MNAQATQPSIAYLAAGAAGMVCGSCLHDNALAAALQRRGVDAVLVPTYTPIRTDEADVSIDRVFLGGVNVYLQQKIPLFSRLPGVLDHWLNRPSVIRWATRRHVAIDARQLGALTVSLLRGIDGAQRKEVDRLCRYLADELRPAMVVLTNMLIAGFVPELKRRRDVPVLVTLQGDDLFLGQLCEPFKTDAIQRLRELAAHVDGFLVNSRYYADHMGRLLDIPPEKLHVLPLGIDTRQFESAAPARPADPNEVVIGYLARIAPEKGFDRLIDAFIALRKRDGMQYVRLHAAGWLGEQHRTYFDAQRDKIDRAGFGDEVRIRGTVDRDEKLQLLGGIDLLCVPTEYREPKGIYALEAMAAGVPVVLPDHGAFPEMVDDCGGGRLFRADDDEHLIATLASLIGDSATRARLGQQGRQRVLAGRNADTMAESFLGVCRRLADV